MKQLQDLSSFNQIVGQQTKATNLSLLYDELVFNSKSSQDYSSILISNESSSIETSSSLSSSLSTNLTTQTVYSILLQCFQNASMNYLPNYTALNELENASMFEEQTILTIFKFACECILYVLLRIRFLFYFVWPSETMFSSLQEVPRQVEQMFPVFISMAVVDIAARIWQGQSKLRLNQSVASLSAGIFQESFRFYIRSIEVLMYCLVYNNFRLFTLPWNSLVTWWVCYIGVDFGFYWAHRLAHEINIIWAVHQAHHSSDEFSAISGLRQAVLQPFTAWMTYVPLALFIPPQIFLAHLQLSELFMAWLHTETIDDIGFLGYIINNPSLHRVHHSRNPEYIDKNYGGVLMIWDHLFGTFAAEEREKNPPVYGLVHQLASYDPFVLQFHPWPDIYKRLKASKSWLECYKILFYGPGWFPGKSNRLGDFEDLPKIIRPINSYNPLIKTWQNAYVVLHFAITIFLYHELTLDHSSFTQTILLSNIGALLFSITTLGMILDDKKNSAIFELIRCISFLLIYIYVSPSFNHELLPLLYSNKIKLSIIGKIIKFVYSFSIAINIAAIIFKNANKNITN